MITVVGHTDAWEAEGKDSELGARRARVAAAYLAEVGIPADRISTVNVGASQPLVRTARGVREPQNRLVQFGISLDGGPKAADSMYQRALCIEWLQKTYCDRSADEGRGKGVQQRHSLLLTRNAHYGINKATLPPWRLHASLA